MLEYLPADMICSENWAKTVSFEKQIMPKNKYVGIFSRQMEAIVFVFLSFPFATRAVLKIGG